MTRRRAAWATVALAAAVVASCTESVPVDVPDRPPPAAPTPEERDGSGGGGEGATGAGPVRVEDGDPGLPAVTRDGTLRGNPVAPGHATLAGFYRRRVADQLARYPAALLERIGLRAAVLCEGLTFDGTACSAFTDVGRGRVYLNIDVGPDGAFLDRTVHHELFHQLDYAGDGALDPDPAWDSLNPPGFRYRGGVERLQADPGALEVDGTPGLVDRYAGASAAEDKAEVYTCLVVDPGGVRRRAALDPALGRKVERVRAMIDAFGPYSGPLIGRD